MVLKIKKLYKDAIIPEYQTPGSVGFDLHAINDETIKPSELKMVNSGLSVEIPKNTVLYICQRSGISINFPNYLATCKGVIDEDYRGEIMFPIINHNKYIEMEIKKGDRIAQGIISPIIKCKIKEVEELDDTERGEKGFGSTGI